MPSGWPHEIAINVHNKCGSMFIVSTSLYQPANVRRLPKTIYHHFLFLVILIFVFNEIMWDLQHALAWMAHASRPLMLMTHATVGHVKYLFIFIFWGNDSAFVAHFSVKSATTHIKNTCLPSNEKRKNPNRLMPKEGRQCCIHAERVQVHTFSHMNEMLLLGGGNSRKLPKNKRDIWIYYF